MYDPPQTLDEMYHHYENCARREGQDSECQGIELAKTFGVEDGTVIEKQCTVHTKSRRKMSHIVLADRYTYQSMTEA